MLIVENLRVKHLQMKLSKIVGNVQEVTKQKDRHMKSFIDKIRFYHYQAKQIQTRMNS